MLHRRHLPWSLALTVACAPAGDPATAASTTDAPTTTAASTTEIPASTTTTTTATDEPTTTAASTPDATTTADADATTTANDGTTGAVDLGPECAPVPYPAPCLDDAVTPPPDGTPGSEGPYAVVTTTLANPNKSAPGDVSVYLPDAPGPFPVVFFAHAYAATDPDTYLDLLHMLASNGLAVVHAPYPSLPPGANKNEIRYACLWDGFTAAVAAHQADFDLTRVGFVGHSFGGGATPELARRGYVEEGWGAAGRFMFIMAPWYSWGSGHDTLPPDVRTVVQVYADDDANDHQIAVVDVWDRLPADLERAWLMVRSDACGCGLNATHYTPLTRAALLPNPENVFNGHDRWAVGRRVHALAGYAFTGDPELRAVAFGADPALGDWFGCDGEPVRPLERSETEPIISACLDLIYPLADRCMHADPDVACP